MSEYDSDSRDPGLAGERTDLAWNRSGLSIIGCGAVIIRGMANTPIARGHLATGICILVLGVAAWALGWWRSARARRRGRRRTTAGDLRPVALGVAAIGVSALVLGILSPV